MPLCIQCGSTKLQSKIELVSVDEVAAVEGTVLQCSDCGEEYSRYYCVEDLTGSIAQSIAQQKDPLSVKQLLFIRKYLQGRIG